jgi:hypothetical protein
MQGPASSMRRPPKMVAVRGSTPSPPSGWVGRGDSEEERAQAEAHHEVDRVGQEGRRRMGLNDAGAARGADREDAGGEGERQERAAQRFPGLTSASP